MFPFYKMLKKKEDKKETKHIPIISGYKGSPNYQLLGSYKKPETSIDFESISSVKKIIFEILKKDREYWDDLKQAPQGIEKYNLSSKVSNQLLISNDVFEIALDELMVEQKIVPFELDNKIRYILLCIQ